MLNTPYRSPVLGPAPTQEPTAVATPAQGEVLAALSADGPATAAELGARTGQHPNTVREHLDALVHDGLLDTVTETPGGRGRPATLYRPTAADPAVGVHDYAGLATALAGHLARTSADPEADARAAGVDWGRELVGEYAGSDDPRARVLEVLARLGFGPDPDTDDPARGIALRSCPLLDAAGRYPRVVCQVHLGIIEGVLDQLGAMTGAGLDLIAFAEPGACRLFLPDPTMPGGDRRD